jgi:hypothetical protein
MWTQLTAAEELPWEWVVARLEAADEYWVTSAAGGRPSSRPVWGHFVDERLLFTMGTPTHHRNTAVDDRVEVHLPSALEVVLVEGTMRRVDDEARLRAFLDAYNAKYDWDATVEEERYRNGVVEVVPSAVIAWVASPPAESSADMDFPLAAGKWVFSRP